MKDIEHKNVKRQVLELLSANVPPKKSQPIRFSVFLSFKRYQEENIIPENFKISNVFHIFSHTIANLLCKWS